MKNAAREGIRFLAAVLIPDHSIVSKDKTFAGRIDSFFFQMYETREPSKCPKLCGYKCNLS